MPIRELKLSDFGLMTVPQVVEAKGWSPKSIQNWVRAGLLPAVVLGTGQGGYFLVRRSDVDEFVPRPRGRPKKNAADPPPKKAVATKGRKK